MKLTTLDIPREQWPEYFKEFSKLYRGWAVTVELLSPDLGDQRAADGPPLQGISFESKGSEAGAILVEVGDTPDALVTRHVRRPKAVRVAETQPGAEVDVQIESQDGIVTQVRLWRRPGLPPPPAAAPASRRRA